MHCSGRQAWDAYHGSFNVADEAVLDRLYQGALEGRATIDSLNLNDTTLFLREFGRDEEADRLARDYVAAQPDDPRFLDLRYHHFSADAPTRRRIRPSWPRSKCVATTARMIAVQRPSFSLSPAANHGATKTSACSPA